MNIFVLDESLHECARSHVDRHVCKMPLELAQILSTAHRVLTTDETRLNPVIYRKTHVNHPCSKWVRETKGNYDWAYRMFAELCDEYGYRYGKTHLCWTKLKDVLVDEPELIDRSVRLTPHALAMPDDCKVDDTVESYRNYYCTHKTHLFSWKNRKRPDWI